MSSKTGSKRSGARSASKKGATMPVTGISGHAGPGKEPVLHDGVPLLEAADKVLMDLILADPKVAPLVLVRVSPTTALVLQENVEALQEALLQAGHLPRLVAPGAGEELKAQSPGEPAPAAEPPSPEESGRGERAEEPGRSGRRGRSKRSARPSDWGDEEELAKILRRLLKQ